MKKFGMFLLVVIVIALAVVTGMLYYDVNNKTEEANSQTMKIAELESKVNDLENQIEEQAKKQQEMEIEDKESKDDIKFDSDKMKIKADKIKYEKAEKVQSDDGIIISENNGDFYISTDIDDEVFADVYPNVKENIKNQKLTGFSGDIKEVYRANFGNGDAPAILFFVMEDGNVEYIETKEMFEKEKYESFGKIKELSNIKGCIDAIAIDKFGDSDGDATEYRTMIAIDEDGYGYDLNQIIIKY